MHTSVVHSGFCCIVNLLQSSEFQGICATSKDSNAIKIAVPSTNLNNYCSLNVKFNDNVLSFQSSISFLCKRTSLTINFSCIRVIQIPKHRFHSTLSDSDTFSNAAFLYRNQILMHLNACFLPSLQHC